MNISIIGTQVVEIEIKTERIYTMKMKNFKRVIASFLALTFVLASVALFAINTSAEEVYQRKGDKSFYLKNNGAIAGTLTVEDTYYADAHCLHIYDVVDYTTNAITPYNLVLSGIYTFTYTDQTSTGGTFEKVATIDGYTYSTNKYSNISKTVNMVKVQHYINYLNAVSIYTDANVNTTFIIE